MGFYLCNIIDENLGIRRQIKCEGSKEKVLASLRENNYTLISYEKIKIKPLKENRRERIYFNLANLLGAGVPLINALEKLGNKWGLSKEIMDTLNEGVPLSMALQGSITPFELALLVVGEKSGKLDSALRRLEVYLATKKRQKARLTSLALYPVITLAIAIFALSFIALFILPEFRELYSSLGASLPYSTQLLLGLGSIIDGSARGAYIYIALALLCLIALVTSILSNKKASSKALLSLPLVGRLIYASEIKDFYLALSICLSSGVYILEALDLCIPLLHNKTLVLSAKKIADWLHEGRTLSNALFSSGLIGEEDYALLRASELSGQLASTLGILGENYDATLAYELELLSKLIEPALSILLGGLVLFIALALFTPMWELGGILH